MKRRSFIKTMALAVGFTALSLGMISRPKIQKIELDWTDAISELEEVIRESNIRNHERYDKVYSLYCSADAKAAMIKAGIIEA